MDKSFDMNGRPYARFGEVKEGTILIADGGFYDPIEGNDDHFCIKDGDELVVKLDKEIFECFDKTGEYPRGYGFKPEYGNCLYVDCEAGGHQGERHYLDGQLESYYYDENNYVDFYLGFYLKE